ncbi:MAG: DEAD/DEAH box helicase [Chloroflexi bacterium]|nr:DEAD/DEAH box helicase [Chloroflexota bacterium]
MDIFDFRNHLVHDYQAYIRSFIHIRDPRIKEYVDASLDAGILWPEPLIQLNPSFEPGDWIDDLVRQGILHPECGKIFRVGKTEQDWTGKPLRLHRHQSDAICAAQTGNNYVLTTGTGSGKSLAYIVPIVNHILQRGSGRGVQAIVVYPMNALANSQYGELEKFIKHGYPDGKGPVTFAKYTGQENDDQRNQIIASPPDIILTNYVMLELILTRVSERQLVQAARGLRFLVLDELHTYRGRQGADVALLVRRVRDALATDKLQCVGTSATLASIGAYDEQRRQVAEVATQLFGSEVKPENVIGETLRRATPETELTNPVFQKKLSERIADSSLRAPRDYTSFVRDPLSIWIESTFEITQEPSARYCWIRIWAVRTRKAAKVRHYLNWTNLAPSRARPSPAGCMFQKQKPWDPPIGSMGLRYL